MTMKRPNVNFDTKPQITVDLPPVLEGYLRWLFRTPPKQKEIIIHRRFREGMAIYSKIYPVEFPPKRPIMDNPVTVILPVTANNKHQIRYRFFTISQMGHEQMIDDLEVLFDKWLYKKFRDGYLRGWTQLQIVDAILRGFNVRKNAVNFDAIKKHDFRNRCRDEEKRFSDLVNHEYSDL